MVHHNNGLSLRIKYRSIGGGFLGVLRQNCTEKTVRRIVVSNKSGQRMPEIHSARHAPIHSLTKLYLFQRARPYSSFSGA